MNDQDFLKSAVPRRSPISLHNDAVEMLAIALGIAGGEVLLEWHKG